MASEPVRTCVGCRERAAKRELVRVTVGSDSEGHPAVVPDPRGTAPGRGAHLHPSTTCYELAVRRKAFGRALRFTGPAGPGGLTSTAVGEHVARLESPARPAAPHDRTSHHPTEDRTEGWSSSS